MRRFLSFAMIAALVVVPAGGALAESPGCDSLNASPNIPNTFSPYDLGTLTLASGDEVVVAGAETTGDGGTELSLRINGGIVATQDPILNTSYIVPVSGGYQIELVSTMVGIVTPAIKAVGTITCLPAPPADDDGDGVLNDDDICDDTVLPDEPAVRLLGARFAAQTDGTFDSGRDRFDDLYTLADTHGCSGAQIIEMEGLGRGHTRFGISKSALEAFIASLNGG